MLYSHGNCYSDFFKSGAVTIPLSENECVDRCQEVRTILQKMYLCKNAKPTRNHAGAAGRSPMAPNCPIREPNSAPESNPPKHQNFFLIRGPYPLGLRDRPTRRPPAYARGLKKRVEVLGGVRGKAEPLKVRRGRYPYSQVGGCRGVPTGGRSGRYRVRQILPEIPR